MNLYLLVEGKRTEAKLYPAWLTALLPDFERIRDIDQLRTAPANLHHYYLFSGNGYPSILKHLEKAVQEVTEFPPFQHLIVIADSEEQDFEATRTEFEMHLSTRHIQLPGTCQLSVIIQHRCIETWLLGNTKFMKKNPTLPQLIDYKHYYDVSASDPETMGRHTFNTHAAFHESYLKRMFEERNLSYSKQFPGNSKERPYLDALINRFNQDGHLASFGRWLTLIEQIRNEVAQQSKIV